MKTISKACKDLMFIEPFYGFYLLHLNKRFSEDLPTAGVYMKGVNTGLDINKEFWEGLNGAERVGLLKHELLHICFFHLETRSEYPDHKVFNIAADLEINQYIKDNKNEALPEGALRLSQFPDLNLEAYKGTKYYYDKIVTNNAKPKNPDQGQGDNQGGSSGTGNSSEFRDEDMYNLSKRDEDIHATWKEFEKLTDAEKKLVKNQIDHVLKESAKQSKKSQGTIPGEMQKYIDELFNIKPPVFDWKAYLRRFAGGSTEVYTKKTRRKVSRRFTGNPGLKIKQRKHILVAIDTSNSVRNHELLEFFNEIHHIYSQGVQITIIECDTRIGDIYKYDGKFRGYVSGRGGTYFHPVIEYFNKNSRLFTSLIYFTDGEAQVPLSPLKQMMWVISSVGTCTENLPGIVIKIPKQ